MKTKNKNSVFICKIDEALLKLVKCLIGKGQKKEFVEFYSEDIPPGISDSALAEKLGQVFKRLEYNNNPVVISLPRNNATCRYLKIPAQSPEEIEKIVSLQAARYLPYPAEELITGYQIVSTSKEGYTHVYLNIVHKDIIERYVKISKELKLARFIIVLNSYGLCNIYNYISHGESGPVMVLDIDSNHAELIVVSRKKMFYSRAFKVSGSLSNWDSLFIDEVIKMRDAYLQEVSGEPPAKFVILGSGRTAEQLSEIIKKRINLQVEIMPYADKINLSDSVKSNISDPSNSWVSLIGLALGETAGSLNLLSIDVKEGLRKLSKGKEYSRVILIILSIVFVLGLGVAKNFDNKKKYNKQLELELAKIEKDAKPLEEFERRLKLLEARLQKKSSGLSVLYELYQIMPLDMSLVSLSYEEDAYVILRGQAPQYNFVRDFVSKLEESSVFSKFSVKLRYATKKDSLSGQVVDFEIVCSKEK